MGRPRWEGARDGLASEGRMMRRGGDGEGRSRM